MAADGVPRENRRIEASLREAAALLAAQGANPFRVLAYRKAADTVGALVEPVRERFERGGREALAELPAIGAGIAGAIAEMLVTGRWSQLHRLRGGDDAAQTLRVVPGIGRALARRIYDTLGTETLESLEVAAHDGRLEGVPGVGPRRARSIAAVLGELLGRSRIASEALRPHSPLAVPIELVLEVDREYRTRAAAGELTTIAPRRFNPQGRRWLPVLHTRRGGWHFTALYSNTSRAHELGREHDWVVVYAIDGDHAERQYTVVTETRGALAGRRVVRGREAESALALAVRPGSPAARESLAGAA